MKGITFKKFILLSLILSLSRCTTTSKKAEVPEYYQQSMLYCVLPCVLLPFFGKKRIHKLLGMNQSKNYYQGKISDEKGNGLEVNIKWTAIQMKDDGSNGNSKSDSKTGNFKIPLKDNRKYFIQYSKEGYITVKEKIEFKKDKKMTTKIIMKRKEK